MKCPKCNYTGFDYLDSCKKCGADLRDTRSLLQIIAVSPEERAPNVPAGGRPAPGAPVAPQPSPDRPEFGSEPPSSSDSELLGSLDFEESFEGMVERTGYEQAAPKPPPEDDELLDLDFGDIFGEDAKKK
jgi:hypothetical protein